jgi:hypothetical protein
VSSELEIVAVDGARSVLAIGRGAHVLTGLGVQVLPVDGGVRIEPLQPGALLHIDGEELLCKQLCAGEFVVIDSVRLRLLGAASTASPSLRSLDSPTRAPASRSAPTRVSPDDSQSELRLLVKKGGGVTRSSRRSQPSAKSSDGPSRNRLRTPKRTSWAPASAITAAVLLVVVFVVQRLRDSSWPHSPKHFVELAQAQFDNNKLERALETLAFALRDGSGDEYAQAVALDEKIRSRLLEKAAAHQVQSAHHEHNLLKSFVATYLRSVERPAARECVRLCDVWIAKNKEACSVHSQGKQLLEATEAMRERFVIPAALGAAESAADVIFAARSMLRFQWRDYIGSFSRIDAFLLRNPGHKEVVAARKTMLAEGEVWVDKQLRRLDRTLQRGDTGNAETDLDKLERWVAIPQWQPRIAERRARLLSGQ